MIFHAADFDGRTIELFGNAAQIRVQRTTRDLVTEQRTTVFGGKGEMNVNGGKGLWHDVRLRSLASFANPKKIAPVDS